MVVEKCSMTPGSESRTSRAKPPRFLPYQVVSLKCREFETVSFFHCISEHRDKARLDKTSLAKTLILQPAFDPSPYIRTVSTYRDMLIEQDQALGSTQSTLQSVESIVRLIKRSGVCFCAILQVSYSADSLEISITLQPRPKMRRVISTFYVCSPSGGRGRLRSVPELYTNYYSSATSAGT